MEVTANVVDVSETGAQEMRQSSGGILVMKERRAPGSVGPSRSVKLGEGALDGALEG